MVVRKPLPKLTGDELAAAVATEIYRVSVLLDQTLQHPLHVLSAVLERRHDGERIGGGFVLDRETANHEADRIPIVHEVIASDVVADQRCGVELGPGDDLALRNP